MPSEPLPIDADPQGPALREAKFALRRQVLAARDSLAAEVRAAKAAAIAARIAALPSYARARTVLLTLPFRNEWDTRPLLESALATGKTVAMPRVNAARRMLELHAIVDPARDVAAGPQGIPEPRPECAQIAPLAIDWVLVPGVTFDRAGRRLGYGGGYYDRLLPLLPSPAPRIAGAFQLQIVERVPAGPHDIAVDAIVTEAETIVPDRRGGERPRL
ncbi:MAG TPA: 5-formyltetrahydrofolate cyclo-ligase [Casimicrobiaceae bacterium]|nr:5-formyltetrahydrofolate cyclo-ligase [Casimicrobiaceae bacterium]